jgi:hypothetical protein
MWRLAQVVLDRSMMLGTCGRAGADGNGLASDAFDGALGSSYRVTSPGRALPARMTGRTGDVPPDRRCGHVTDTDGGSRLVHRAADDPAM